MSEIEPTTFGFVTDHAEYLLAENDGVEHELSSTNLVLFTQEFYRQFFAEVFEIEVKAFSNAVAVDVQAKLQSLTKKRNSKPADPDVASPDGTGLAEQITATFREFCQDFETIVGEQYDDEDEDFGITDFESDFVPGLLELIVEWAQRTERDEVEAAAVQAKGELEHALSSVFG